MMEYWMGGMMGSILSTFHPLRDHAMSLSLYSNKLNSNGRL